MNKLFISLLFIASLFVTACSNDEHESIPPFSLTENYYEVRLGQYNHIDITNGSGDISLAVKDGAIMKATYEGGLLADELRGVVHLQGLKKGTTTLTITDNKTHDKQTIEVKVTDCYLAYGISKSNHPVLKTGTVLFMVNNQAHDCYLFAIDNIHGKLYDTPIMKSNYDFYVTTYSGSGPAPQIYGIPHLQLLYPSDKNENLAGTDIVATPHDFQIKMYGENASSPHVPSIIEAYLGVDWEELMKNAQARNNIGISLPRMIMTIPDTDYVINGVLTSYLSIPKNVLD